MIAQLVGEVVDKSSDSLVLDVSGVGYEVKATSTDLDQCLHGTQAKLFTYFAVRENAQELYGFLTLEAKRLFELLLSVSGVGPKVALSIVGLGEPVDVRSAIANNNVAYIVGANGVGKRGAEKVIVELKDKVGRISETMLKSDNLQIRDDALEGLISLGYSRQQAAQCLSRIDSSLSPEQRITQALKELSS